MGSRMCLRESSGGVQCKVTNFAVHLQISRSSPDLFLLGISHLYASATSKNPGPLDPDSVKNEDNNSPRAVSVKLHGTKVSK